MLKSYRYGRGLGRGEKPRSRKFLRCRGCENSLLRKSARRGGNRSLSVLGMRPCVGTGEQGAFSARAGCGGGIYPGRLRISADRTNRAGRRPGDHHAYILRVRRAAFHLSARNAGGLRRRMSTGTTAARHRSGGGSCGTTEGRVPGRLKSVFLNIYRARAAGGKKHGLTGENMQKKLAIGFFMCYDNQA